MKKFKKVFAVLLTLAMVLGMSMTSFAAQKGTITVNGLKEGTVVSYAQILKLDAKGNAWEFVDDVDASVVGADLDTLTTKNPDNMGKINTNLTGLTLQGLTYKEMGTVANGATSVTSEQLEAGLYAIKAVDSTNEYVYSYMVAAIDYKDGQIQNATLAAKGEKSQPHKAVTDANKTSTSANDTIGFTITVDYPTFATSSVTKKFEIKDTVTNAKIDFESVKINATNSGLAVNEDASNETTLVIELNAEQYNPALAGTSFTITYSVTVDAAADLEGDGTVTNKVETTVPDQNGNDLVKQSIVNIPTVTADITKADATTKEPVTGSSATFELYKVVESGTEGAVALTTSEKDANDQFITVTAVKVDEQSTVSTTGVASFKGLDATAIYYVKETKAPEGYSVNPNAYKLTGASATKGIESQPELVEGVWTTTTTYQVTPFNSVGFGADMKFLDDTLGSLPSTGGIGTTIFTIGGCAIMIIAAALYFASRRRAAK